MAHVLSEHTRMENELNALKQQGEAPEWYTPSGYTMFKRKYAANESETVNGAFTRIAETLAKLYTPDPELARTKFLHILTKGFLAPSTPVMCNTGTNRGHSVSCSGNYTGDSIDDFYKGYREVALLSQRGYGTSSELSNIRPRGTPISTGGTADGAVPVFDSYMDVARKVSQGNNRRGQWAGYLDAHHGDFWEMSGYVLKNAGDANIGWNYRDEYIDSLREGDEEAILRWEEMMYIRARHGKGYVWKPDVANRNAPPVIKGCGIPISASNLCVTGDTLIHTQDGMVKVKDLYDSNAEFNAVVDIRTELAEAEYDFDKDHYTTENIKYDDRGRAINEKGTTLRETNGIHLTKQDAEVYTVTLDGGYEIKCTSYHKFYTYDSATRIITKKPLNEIDISKDKLLLQSEEGNFGNFGSYALGYFLGSLYGDGSLDVTSNGRSHYARIKFWNITPEYEAFIDQLMTQLESEYRLEARAKRTYSYRNDSIIEYNLTSESSRRFAELVKIASKKNFPEVLYTANREMVSGFINGIFDADACSFKTHYGKENKFSYGIQQVSINEEVLKGIQKLLINFGIYSRVFKHKKTETPFTDPHTGVEYVAKPKFRLDLGGKATSILQAKLGCVFQDPAKESKLTSAIAERDELFNNVPLRNTSMTAKIKSIEYYGIEDVYDTTQLHSHSLIFNGIVTGNCTEIALPQNEDYTYSCVLSSLNLTRWDEFEEDTIFWSIIFLDCVVSNTLVQTEGLPGFEKIHRFTKEFRALGLGALGWHSLLQSKSIPFESFDAMMLNKRVFSTIRVESERATKFLAEKLGEPLMCVGYGVRNATLNAIAPNTSSAFLCGGVSQGIEPLVANTFNQNTAAGEFTRVNPYLVDVLKKYGIYSQELIDDIDINYLGSVQHLPQLSEHEKLVFRTAFEMDQMVLVNQAAQRQPDIDQGQSLNLFFFEDEEYISSVMHEVVLNENIKGAYYQRSIRGVRSAKNECLVCEG